MLRFFSPAMPLLKGWLFSVLGWGLLAFALGWQLVRLTSMSPEDAARIVARDWMAWALITPLLFRLVLRLPLEREGWKIAVPVHLAGCVGSIAFCIWWSQLITPPTPPWRADRSRPEREFRAPAPGEPGAERRPRGHDPRRRGREVAARSVY
jgi:hypothetical protein